jgi:hypothetical protein
VSGSVKTTSLILGGLIPCADRSTICARRQVTTEPLVCRTMRSSRLPSSFVISRSFTRAAMWASRSLDDRDHHFYDDARRPFTNPANVAGCTTRLAPWQRAEQPLRAAEDKGGR